IEHPLCGISGHVQCTKGTFSKGIASHLGWLVGAITRQVCVQAYTPRKDPLDVMATARGLFPLCFWWQADGQTRALSQPIGVSLRPVPSDSDGWEFVEAFQDGERALRFAAKQRTGFRGIHKHNGFIPITIQVGEEVYILTRSDFVAANPESIKMNV